MAEAILVTLLGIIGFAASTFWHEGGPARWGVQSESPIPTRKQRFAEYVRGERQLMADWEEAFDPKGTAFAQDVDKAMRRMKDEYAVTGNLYKPRGVAGYNPAMRFSSSQVCWDHARYMMGDGHSHYSDFQRVVSHCERMDA